jgi:hypothetical protein
MANLFKLDVADEDMDIYDPNGDTVIIADQEIDEEDELVAEEDEDQVDEDELAEEFGETLDEEDAEEVYDDEDESEEIIDEEEEEEEEESTPGIDEVIRLVQEHGGDGASALVRGLAKTSVQSAEISALRKELEVELRDARALKTELVELADEEEEEEGEEVESDEDKLARVAPEQLELLDAYVRSKGFIKQDDLTLEEQTDLATEMEMSAVELFGDEFGIIDEESGEFVLNPDLQSELVPTYNRLVNDQNLTFSDLFILANFEALLDSSMDAGIAEGISSTKEASAKRIAKLKRSGLSGAASNSGSSRKGVYDKESLKGQPASQRIGSVMKQFWDAV